MGGLCNFTNFVLNLKESYKAIGTGGYKRKLGGLQNPKTKLYLKLWTNLYKY